MASDDVLVKNRGLGMLLASMGGTRDPGGPINTSNMGRRGQNMNQNMNQGFDVQSSGFSNWSDLSGMGNRNPGDSKMNAQNNSGQAGAQRGRSTERKTSEFRDEDVYGPRSINGWADIKEYDDDHDSEWFQAENGRLAKQYGGNFIHAKYLESQPGRVGYFCQLCSAEMNAKKSLELHCSGMKHLKKKDQWEKGELEQVESGENTGSWREKNPAPTTGKDSHRSPPRSWSDRADRGNPRRDSYGVNRPREDSRSYKRGPSPNHRRDDCSRYSDYRYDDYYRTGPMAYGSAYDRDRVRDAYSRGSPDRRYDYDRHPGPLRREVDDRYSRERERERERYNPYARREAPPPPVISDPAPARNNPNVAAAPIFEGISDGSCSELLRKLSVCRVKSREDTALATNVASFLVMSLKEYYTKSGPATIVHLLDEIILKINIMKDLQK